VSARGANAAANAGRGGVDRVPQRQPDVRDVAPSVQRLRVRFAKRGRLRFTSHRDFQRVFERAIRRAGVPVAFSAGFSPHPKISYVGAASTGAASEAEYLELALSRSCEPDAVRRALDDALPAGFDVIDVVEARGGSLPDRIDASRWQITISGVTSPAAQSAVAAFLQADSVPVERVLKDGRRLLDARSAVVRLEVISGGSGVAEPGEPGDCAILELVVRHLTPAVRPDDVLAGLRQVGALAPSLSPSVTRLAQGHLDESGQLADPLAPDREPAAGSPAESTV
jgi:radical SAM-linked protein